MNEAESFAYDRTSALSSQSWSQLSRAWLLVTIWRHSGRPATGTIVLPVRPPSGVRHLTFKGATAHRAAIRCNPGRMGRTRTAIATGQFSPALVRASSWIELQSCSPIPASTPTHVRDVVPRPRCSPCYPERNSRSNPPTCSG